MILLRLRPDFYTPDVMLFLPQWPMDTWNRINPAAPQAMSESCAVKLDMGLSRGIKMPEKNGRIPENFQYITVKCTWECWSTFRRWGSGQKPIPRGATSLSEPQISFHCWLSSIHSFWSKYTVMSSNVTGPWKKKMTLAKHQLLP